MHKIEKSIIKNAISKWHPLINSENKDNLKDLKDKHIKELCDLWLRKLWELINELLNIKHETNWPN